MESIDIRVIKSRIADLEGNIARIGAALNALTESAPIAMKVPKRDALATYRHQLADERTALALLEETP